MENIIPIFKTDGSLGRSILTSSIPQNGGKDDLELREDSTISIFSIVNEFKLKELLVIEDSFLSFPTLYKNSKRFDTKLIFGLNFMLCNDVADKTEKSFASECKISVVMKNSNGYKDLIKLHDAINANVDNFYYICRGDYNILQNNWTDNLELIIPPFDNFIHKNYLLNGNCLPQFGAIKPTLTYASMELPWNEILNKKTIDYAKNNNIQLKEVHPVYYYKSSDFKAYCIFRAINNRAKFPNPNISYFCSDMFSFEQYCKKIGVKI